MRGVWKGFERKEARISGFLFAVVYDLIVIYGKQKVFNGLAKEP